MKGALACYVEAVRALSEAGVRLQGDVLVAAVAGEIEKTQQGDAQGAEYRGYAAGSRYLVGARRRRRYLHPRRADGEQARARALRHALAPPLRARAVRPHRVQRRADRGELDRAHARVLDARARVAARVGGGDVLRRRARRRQRRRDPGRLRLARLADAARDRPVRRPARAADVPMAEARRRGARVRARARRRRGRGLRDRAGRGDRRGPPARRRDRRGARGGLRLARRSAT